MPITEDTVAVGDKYVLVSEHGCKYPLTIDGVSKAYWTYAAMPEIEKIDASFEKNMARRTSDIVNVFHAITDGGVVGEELGSYWISFRDNNGKKKDRTYDDDDDVHVNIYPDDIEYGHCLWCGGAYFRLHKITVNDDED